MIRGLVVGTLVVAAAALLALAWQARAWQNRIAEDDLRVEVTPADASLWEAPSGPATGVARRFLALDDDLRFRVAERDFVRVHVRARSYAAEAQRLAAFGEAQSALERLSRRDPSPTRRARAANLLGILLWENAESAQENAPLLARQSASAFRRAIAASGDDADAKYNLELLLNVLQPAGDRRRDAPDRAGGSGLRGAGVTTAGSGY